MSLVNLSGALLPFMVEQIILIQLVMLKFDEFFEERQVEEAARRSLGFTCENWCGFGPSQVFIVDASMLGGQGLQKKQELSVSPQHE